MSNGQVSMDTRLDLKTLEEKFKGKTLGLWMLSVTGTKQALIRCSLLVTGNVPLDLFQLHMGKQKHI